jgi:hypothetical protein
MLGIQKIFILFDVIGVVVSAIILSRCIGILSKRMLKIEHMLWKWLVLGFASISFLMT